MSQERFNPLDPLNLFESSESRKESGNGPTVTYFGVFFTQGGSIAEALWRDKEKADHQSKEFNRPGGILTVVKPVQVAFSEVRPPSPPFF